MECLDRWRVAQVMGIAPDHQTAAFHLLALTEEKFRVSHLSNTLAMVSSFGAHLQMRSDIFALEWALRALSLPQTKFTSIEKVRNSWRKPVADRAFLAIKNLAEFGTVRDLIICAKRGGYLLDTPSQGVYRFTDNPDWPGVSDIKSRLMGEIISEDRDPLVDSVTPEAFTLDRTSLFEDFPHDIRAATYTGSDFWLFWKHVCQMCLNRSFQDCVVHNYGTFAATTETRELGILITKRRFIDGIVVGTGLKREVVSLFLQWMMLNSHTDRKFSLFHCPFVEVNEKFLLIAPHVVLLAHAPTIFLRLLAHHDKAAYDMNCTGLEKKSLKRLKSHIEGSNRIVRTNVKLPTPQGSNEFDIVEYDCLNAILSIGQAKFTVRPDSPSDVDHVNSVIKKGANQLERDRSLLSENQANIKELLSRIGAKTDNVVDIQFFLLPTRFSGSDFLDIPSWIRVLPIEFCLRPQCKGDSLPLIWDEYRVLWDSLDQKVVSARGEEEFKIGRFKIVCPCFRVSSNQAN